MSLNWIIWPSGHPIYLYLLVIKTAYRHLHAGTDSTKHGLNILSQTIIDSTCTEILRFILDRFFQRSQERESVLFLLEAEMIAFSRT
jgi:hypothetical protein